jgi:hypothetical protein
LTPVSKKVYFNPITIFKESSLMKKYIIAILPIILIAVSFSRAQAIAEESSSIIVFSEDHIAAPTNNPAYDSLMVYSHKVDSLQSQTESQSFHNKTQADRMKYYGVLRDLAKAKSVYCQQIAIVYPDCNILAKKLSWDMRKKADSLQSHIYAMSSETQPKVTVGGKMSMSKELQDMFR